MKDNKIIYLKKCKSIKDCIENFSIFVTPKINNYG